ARLEYRGLGVGADVAGDLEPAERAAALGVRLPLLDPLPVEVGHLLDQVTVLQQDRAARADGQRIRVALDRDAGISRLDRVRLRACHVPFLLRMEPWGPYGPRAVLRDWPGRARRGHLSPGLS